MLNNTRNIRGQPCPARDYEISRKGTTFFPTLQILPATIPENSYPLFYHKMRFGLFLPDSGRNRPNRIVISDT